MDETNLTKQDTEGLTEEKIKNINTLDELMTSLKEEGKHTEAQAMNILYNMAKTSSLKSPSDFTIDIDTNHVKLPQAVHPETKQLTYHVPLGNSMNALGNLAFNQFLGQTKKLTIVHPDPPFWFHHGFNSIIESLESPEGKRVAKIPSGWINSENCAVTKFYNIMVSLMEINDWWTKMG